MKAKLRRGTDKLLLSVAVAAFTVSTLSLKSAEVTPEETEKAEDESEEVVIPTAIFVDDYKNKGLDPFFPNSDRRLPEPPKPVVKAEEMKKEEEPPPPPPPTDPYDDLVLKGVLGGRRPIATVSTTVKNYQVEPGEQRIVKVPDHINGGVKQVMMKVTKIDADSVMVIIGDTSEPRSLKMPAKK